MGGVNNGNVVKGIGLKQGPGFAGQGGIGQGVHRRSHDLPGHQRRFAALLLPGFAINRGRVLLCRMRSGPHLAHPSAGLNFPDLLLLQQFGQRLFPANALTVNVENQTRPPWLACEPAYRYLTLYAQWPACTEGL